MSEKTLKTNDTQKVVNKKVELSETKPKKRVFKTTDIIPCMSITSGRLLMKGVKSNINYFWSGRGEVIDVEYQDLTAAIRSGKKHIFEPYFIIQDEDFLSEFPQVQSLYSSMYSVSDLKDVLRLPPEQMKTVIKSLPNGAKESIKNIASTMISNGSFDSVKGIKALDEVFNTNFMLMTELFN